MGWDGYLCSAINWAVTVGISPLPSGPPCVSKDKLKIGFYQDANDLLPHACCPCVPLALCTQSLPLHLDPHWEPRLSKELEASRREAKIKGAGKCTQRERNSWVPLGCLFLLGSQQFTISCGSQQTSYPNCYRCLKCRFSGGCRMA